MTKFRDLFKSTSDFFGLINNSYSSILDKIFYSKYFLRWLKYIQPNQTALNNHIPWIVFEAEELLKSYLNNNSNIFEFGSGGSTLFFSKYAKNVFSVEHNYEWFQKVASEVKREKNNNWQGFLEEPTIIDTYEFKQLDFADPLNYKSSDIDLRNFSFQNYAKKILIFDENFFDIVFIDGRARPSCLMHSYSKVKPGGLLILDNSERPYYVQKTKPENNGFSLLKEMYGPGPFHKGFWQTTIWVKNNYE